MATGITVDFSKLRQTIAQQQRALSATELRERLQQVAELYVERLRADIRSKVSSRATGNLERALCTIIPPWPTDRGWAIGVGSIARVGLPSEGPVSRTTIREFRDWFDEQLEAGAPEAVRAQAERLEARAIARKQPTVGVAEYTRQIAQRAQAWQAEEAAELQKRVAQIAQRHGEFQRLGVAPADAGRVIEAGRSAVTRLRQEVAALRAERDVRIASAPDARARQTYRDIYSRRIYEAQFEVTRIIALLRAMRDTEK